MKNRIVMSKGTDVENIVLHKSWIMLNFKLRNSNLWCTKR
jgi:hypothetical protein